ncbi:DapH/DapD/GlmU-related protein [Clostridium felsineum]|uniref:2,3,4,5-tetrahydropyridine-2,6-dicarboxylate N-acetyltransferase n=1 Tax=Clostridium felsineum TaxID=36839 RepID=A0A1S8L093_9CLOT|nr:DapH/DapD/GlmU-related protein [Clostridium felsineum]URZ00937.1 2,3,4,5-tetrahydropyridine-2,6-dicarboxylate N-acetyltransferase [Clostridium felsineum]URZ06317.1 2,3,4,5-tetrahydropyridine-2,6-dicarboxylate N-acetyltransferase [Clostridium felsineum]URZ11352.1 2,3,4,5-tetrahydropyridine-2,6-dicarboxylate N-acetyltransferase [Clostridium felsineum]
MLKNCSLEEFVKILNVNKNKKLIIFGASKMGEVTLKILKQKNIKVNLIFDNDSNKNNKLLEDVKVVMPYENKENNYIILITSMYYKEISEQLTELGYSKNIFYIRNICNSYNKLADIIEKNNTYVEIDSSSVLMGDFEIIRGELEEKVHLVIGKSSLLYCKISYQSNTGLVEIGDRSYIASNTKLICVDKIHIGNDVLISWDCTIYDNDSHSIDFEYRKNDVLNMLKSLNTTGEVNSNKQWNNVKSKPIIIEDKVWIGFGVTILKGVTIGEGAVIGAGSVVTSDVPPYTVAAGNPARVLRSTNN